MIVRMYRKCLGGQYWSKYGGLIREKIEKIRKKIYLPSLLIESFPHIKDYLALIELRKLAQYWYVYYYFIGKC